MGVFKDLFYNIITPLWEFLSDHKLDTNCKKNGFNYQRTSKEAENNWIINH